MKFEFVTVGQILFGAGRLREIGPLAKTHGHRALVVGGNNVGRAEKLLTFLREVGVDTTTFSVAGEPELATVEQGTSLARRKKCDLVIGFGGGSVIDAAKAIAAMMTNEGALLDYVEIIGKGRALSQPSAPFIAIPTTAGPVRK